MGITGLALATANLLFDFLETGFDFPPRTIVLDDLFNGQVQVSRKESNPLGFTKDPGKDLGTPFSFAVYKLSLIC